jgi:hypothetical protein
MVVMEQKLLMKICTWTHSTPSNAAGAPFIFSPYHALPRSRCAFMGCTPTLSVPEISKEFFPSDLMLPSLEVKATTPVADKFNERWGLDL